MMYKNQKDSHRVIGQSLPRVALFALLAMISGCAVVKDSGSTGAITAKGPTLVQEKSTAAGFPFLYFPMPDSDRTAVAITWHTDLPQALAGREAATRLGIDLMLNGGAGGLAAEEIIADFEDLDAGSKLWIQPQEISGFIVSPEIHINKASDIANLVLTQPNLEQQWFAREKKNLSEQAAERESVVGGQAWNLFRQVSLGDHPYERFWSLQPLKAIKDIELSDITNWYADAFSTAAMTITVAGQANSAIVSAAIDRVLDGMPDQTRGPMQDFPTPKIPPSTILLHQPDAEKSVILAFGQLPSHTDGKDIPLQLGIGVLGYGKQSRLFKTLRSKLRASYGFGAGTFDLTRQYTMMHISGEVETGKLQLALDETRATYEKFRNKGISLIEFPIAKRFYLQRIREEIKKPSSVAYMLMDAELNKFGNEYVPTLIDQIAEQDRTSVNNVIKESLPAFDSLLKIIVTPDATAIEGACVITEINQWQKCV